MSRMTDGERPERADDNGEPRISYVVARLERAIRGALNERLQRFGLTTGQYTTLSVLGRRGGLSNAQLARRSYMTPQSMSEVLEALERKGLVARRPHPRHRRIQPAALTAKGRRVLAACEHEVDALEEEMLGGLAPAERAHLAEGLMAAVRALRAGLPPR